MRMVSLTCLVPFIASMSRIMIANPLCFLKFSLYSFSISNAELMKWNRFFSDSLEQTVNLISKMSMMLFDRTSTSLRISPAIRSWGGLTAFRGFLIWLFLGNPASGSGSTWQLVLKLNVPMLLLSLHLKDRLPPSSLHSYLATCRPIWSFFPSEISKSRPCSFYPIACLRTMLIRK